jgi:hypothetical protein
MHSRFTMGVDRNAFSVMEGKSRRNRPFVRPKPRRVSSCRMAWTWIEHEQVAGSCEYGDKISGSINVRESAPG